MITKQSPKLINFRSKTLLRRNLIQARQPIKNKINSTKDNKEKLKPNLQLPKHIYNPQMLLQYGGSKTIKHRYIKNNQFNQQQEGELFRSLTDNNNINLSQIIKQIKNQNVQNVQDIQNQRKMSKRPRRITEGSMILLPSDLCQRKKQLFKIRKKIKSNNKNQIRTQICSTIKKVIDYKKYLSLTNSQQFYQQNMTVTLKGVLGMGANAQVKLGQNKYQKFAIKIYNKDKYTKNKRNRIYSQIKILQNLPRHSNIIQMINAYENKKQIHILFQYIQRGRTLQQYLLQNNNKISQKQLKQIYYKIIKGVYHLHNNGISHRDLKPANIMIGFDQDDKILVKIIDFGSAIDKKGYNTYCGTLNYMAPQLFNLNISKNMNNNNNINNQCQAKFSDIWSLGIILYYMCQQGKYPFYGNTQLQLQNCIKKGKYIFNKCQNKFIIDIIKKMLQIQPNKRINASQLLKCQWFYNNQ